MNANSIPPSATSPLSGIVVIEIGHSVAAPFAGQVLADLGARVIKVENPNGGDDARSWGPPFLHGASATFQSLNRNKSSVTIDFKSEADLDKLKALADGADVLIQNMRPGLVEQYGIDAGSLRSRNPGLIYFNLGAFGDVGPLRERPGYDPLMQAFAGIMSVTGEAGRPPVRVGPSIVDIGTGLWGVIGVLASLVRRKETGEGCTIDGSLYETALAWMNIPIVSAIASGAEPGRTGSETSMLAPYKAFEASDGFVVIAAGNDNLFRRLCAVLGKPEWSEDARFRANSDRVLNRVVLNDLIEEIVRGNSADFWVDELSRVGVPCALTQPVSKVVAHPQTEALEMVSATPDGTMRLVRMPLKFDGGRPEIRTNPPALGAHNALLSADGPASADDAVDGR